MVNDLFKWLYQERVTSSSTVSYSISLSLYPFHIHMPPKNEFTIPLGKTVNVVTTTRRSKREVRTSEKVAPLPSVKSKELGKASGSRRRTEAIVPDTSGGTSQSTEEVHTLPSTEPQEDDIQDFDIVGDSQSNVCGTVPSNVIISLMICRGQWINGLSTEGDISIFSWRWKDSRRLQSVRCAPTQWRSSALIALEETTSARLAVSKYTSGPHSIGCPDGLVHTLHPHHFIP